MANSKNWKKIESGKMPKKSYCTYLVKLGDNTVLEAIYSSSDKKWLASITKNEVKDVLFYIELDELAKEEPQQSIVIKALNFLRNSICLILIIAIFIFTFSYYSDMVIFKIKNNTFVLVFKFDKLIKRLTKY